MTIRQFLADANGILKVLAWDINTDLDSHWRWNPKRLKIIIASVFSLAIMLAAIMIMQYLHLGMF